MKNIPRGFCVAVGRKHKLRYRTKTCVFVRLLLIDTPTRCFYDHQTREPHGFLIMLLTQQAGTTTRLTFSIKEAVIVAGGTATSCSAECPVELYWIQASWISTLTGKTWKVSESRERGSCIKTKYLLNNRIHYWQAMRLKSSSKNVKLYPWSCLCKSAGNLAISGSRQQLVMRSLTFTAPFQNWETRQNDDCSL